MLDCLRVVDSTIMTSISIVLSMPTMTPFPFFKSLPGR